LKPLIILCNSQKDLTLPVRKIRQAILFILRALNLQTSQVCFHFVSEKRISAIHAELFDDPSVTDCITIPIDPPVETPPSDHILGEAFVCPSVAMQYAKKRGKDPYQELYRYVVHCLLHFAGHNDTTTKEKSAMRRKENYYLKKLCHVIPKNNRI
jgi:probable rRNA maturation factor